MVIGIIIGIMIWQLVGFAVLAATNDEEKTAIVGVVVPWAIFGACMIVFKKIQLAYYKKNYSLCSLYSRKEDKEHGYHGGIGIKNKDINKYYHDGENEYFIKIYENGKDFKSCPYETMTSIRKNGWLCQEWVDDHFKK